nr:MAG TPA: hypothetical protein [Caudoviricetes sp.]
MFFDRKSRPRCYSTGDGKRYKKSLPFTQYIK